MTAGLHEGLHGQPCCSAWPAMAQTPRLDRLTRDRARAAHAVTRARGWVISWRRTGRTCPASSVTTAAVWPSNARKTAAPTHPRASGGQTAARARRVQSPPPCRPSPPMNGQTTSLAAAAAAVAPVAPLLALVGVALALLALADSRDADRAETPEPAPAPVPSPRGQDRLTSGKFASRVRLSDLRATFARGRWPRRKRWRRSAGARVARSPRLTARWLAASRCS